MKISACPKAPQWIKNAITENADVEVSIDGRVIWRGGDFLDGNFRGRQCEG